jgi:hypothetical protein
MESDARSKVVQTELSEEEYRRFRAFADEEDVSIKEALRRAAREYVDERARPDPADPFFSYHEEGVEATEATDAREMDDDLYGE